MAVKFNLCVVNALGGGINTVVLSLTTMHSLHVY